MWLLIFLPAWTLNDWQGWGFFLSFAIPVTLISLHFLKHNPDLMKTRVKAGPTAEKQRHQQLIQTIDSISFISILLTPGLDHHFLGSTLPWPLSITGDILIIIGLTFVAFVFRENTFTSAVIEIQTNQHVITTGPYAHIRHPMYAGASLMLLGVPLALASLYAYIPVLILIIVIIARLLDEERYLTIHLPGYTDYCHTVCYRLIPHLW
jgi:protein-S-isoprenylcysteine O-methyltransferase Ste14